MVLTDFICKFWLALVARPDGSWSRSNITMTMAYIVATIWISYGVYISGKIEWDLLAMYLAFATGNVSFNKYLAMKTPESK